ncbi:MULTISPECIES: hypothetical protein [unclassified Streptomyces]|uniref:hypothetical protein n=1 Tax=unclassified Streptomyces TaxID=2593676 RepID=UPI0033EA1CA5
MRPAQDVSAGPSATPIYDALYSEYRRSFRTLPGDRSGEEELGFRSFGAGTYRQAAHGQDPGRRRAGWSAYALPPGPRPSP